MPASASLPRPLAIHSPLPRSPGLRLRRARTGAGIQPSSFSPPPPPPARPGPRPAPRPPARLRAPAAPPAFSGWERAGGQRAARTQTAAGGRAPRGPAGSSASGGARGEGGRARPTGARGQGEGSDGGSRPPPSHSSGTISRVVSHARLRRLFGCDAVVGATPAREGRDYFQSQSGGGCTKAAAPLRPQKMLPGVQDENCISLWLKKSLQQKLHREGPGVQQSIGESLDSC
ncbi:translation initiation factor IF-2-like [Gallus gallus]|uniref:translation initiation factor IF-2-like n=1 Tax=Gallus gallus TaxID=9031 RepID=UPI001AE84F7F|nr:translation initiation factor IF-2-like [Gallus gallus]XP_040516846.1 translation initiation factor IF-2-like [Gallus gallus]